MGLKRLTRAAATSAAVAPTPTLPAVADSSGGLMVSVGKYARSAVLGVFEQIGGQGAMAEWASANQTDFYTKLFAKTITREVEEKRVDSIEDLLDAIDAEATLVATDAEFEDV
jgi:hypothetical protein